MQFVNRLPRIAAALLLAVVVPWVAALPSNAHPPDNDHTHTKQADSGTAHGTLGQVGSKLSDPTANIWALSMSFGALKFFDGNANAGDPEVGGSMNFQPVMPFPVYGTGDDEWKVVTRPVIPIIFSEPVPKGAFDSFKHRGGLGDIQIPLLLNPSASLLGKNWILGAGPVFEFPTSTRDSLGNQQFAMGPAVVVGYKNELLTAVLFPNYFWRVANRSDKSSTTPATSKLSLLYALNIALPNAWQVGFNPTISYNDKATSGNKWNVPIGVYAGRTIKVGRMPVNIKLGMEYSVVSADTFGERAQIRLQVTPVIPGLVSSPIFGGE